jgi:hypothetical protein
VCVCVCGLHKLEQRANNCVELGGGFVEEIPSLVAVACFLLGQANDLSAPTRVSSPRVVLLSKELEYMNA